MKIYLVKAKKIILRNTEFFLLFLLIFFAIFSTQFYNLKKQKTVKGLISLNENIYFQKSLEHILNNLKPKYKTIKHNVTSGESFNSILKDYDISDKEIKKINTTLLKLQNSNRLKVNQVIKFTIDQSKNKKIIYLLYPVSKTKKIEIKRNIDKDIFENKEIVTNLKKRIVFSEGVITHSLYKSAESLKIPINLILISLECMHHCLLGITTLLLNRLILDKRSSEAHM